MSNKSFTSQFLNKLDSEDEIKNTYDVQVYFFSSYANQKKICYENNRFNHATNQTKYRASRGIGSIGNR